MITPWILHHRKAQAQLDNGNLKACLQNVLLGNTQRGVFTLFIIGSVKLVNTHNTNSINTLSVN